MPAVRLSHVVHTDLVQLSLQRPLLFGRQLFLRLPFLHLDIDVAHPLRQPEMVSHIVQIHLIEFPRKQGDDVARQIRFLLAKALLLLLLCRLVQACRLFQNRSQLLPPDRLEYVVHAVIPQRLLRIREIAVTAQDNKIRVRNILRPDLLQQLQSCHNRHLNVCKDQFHLVFLQIIQGLFSICRRSCNLIPRLLPINQNGQPLNNKRFIINQQYSEHFNSPFPHHTCRRAESSP